MADPNFFDPIRIPLHSLAALDWRPYHFALQPYHYLVRIVHILTMAGFFGGIVLLDLRLIGWRAALPLRSFADHVLPWLWVTFGVAVLSGLALFAYDPLHVGAHAYFTPKLIMIALGLLNAAIFHRTSYVAALAAVAQPPAAARIAASLSILFWTGAIVFACLDTEAAPKVLLR